MNGLNRLCVMTATSLLGSMTVMAAPALGGPIVVNLVSADYSNISPSPPQVLQHSFTLTTGVGTFTGNGGMLGGLMVDTLTIDISTATVTPPPFKVTGPVTVNAPGMLITFADATHHATFKINNAMISADFTPNGTATIDGQAVLEANTFLPAVVDLSAFTGPNGSDFKAVFQGLQFTGTPGLPPTVSWTGPVVAAVTITPAAAPVPEPASLMTWALTGLAGIGAVRRRRRPTAGPATASG